MRGFEKIDTKFLRELKEIKEENDIILPQRTTQKSAGYDFYIPYSMIINPGESKIIKTGVKSFMNDDEVLLLFIRSSLAIKKHLRLLNQVGVIDADYYNNSDNNGHILIAIENYGENMLFLNKGDRIAQGVFVKYLTSDNEDGPTNLRNGGIGSTN